MRIAVLERDELAPGEMKAVDAGGVSVVVIRKADGSYRALRNRCSHQGGALALGRLESLVEGEAVGEYRFSKDRVVLRCPLHHFEFDIDTGLSPADPARVRVKSYDVFVGDDGVYIDR
jgi:nitrite reductase/ring-hydroxylating ferredoxin subunit